MTSFVYRFRGISVGATKGFLFLLNVSRWAPKGVWPWVLEHSKLPALVRLRANRLMLQALARNLIESKRKEVKEGVTRGDVMSLLGMMNAFSAGLGVPAHL